MRKLIQGGTIVNEGQMLNGAIVIEDNRIAQILTEHTAPRGNFDEIVDASGCFVLPGVIDTHVHFREPGMENKADMESESRAAAVGGVTSFFEMPNTNPQTTTIEALNDKVERAKRSSHINYSFFFGATNNNADTIKQLDRHTVPGIKLFMGASTGNDNMKQAKMRYGDDPDICHHYEIRSEEACFQSSQLAVELALKHHTQLHIAHLSTARELGLLQQPHVRDFVTMEAVIAHLYFTNDDYATKGALIKCNPSVKTAHDRAELRRALADGRITTVATDHAPHLLSQKQGGCATAASGMPMVQYSLPTMLELVDSGVLTLERLVELMAHAPAKRFNISERGFLREGYRADIAIVQPNTPWTVTETDIQSKCKWSPMLGHEYRWKVVHTLCNGAHILDGKRFNADYRGEQIRFRNEKIDCL